MARRPQITLERARLALEPERSISKAGNDYMRLRFAVNPTHKVRGGQEVKDDVMYFDAIIYSAGLIRRCLEMLHKGSAVTVSGGLKTEAYIDKNGNPQAKMIIEWPRIGMLIEEPWDETGSTNQNQAASYPSNDEFQAPQY